MPLASSDWEENNSHSFLQSHLRCGYLLAKWEFLVLILVSKDTKERKHSLVLRYVIATHMILAIDDANIDRVMKQHVNYCTSTDFFLIPSLVLTIVPLSLYITFRSVLTIATFSYRCVPLLL